MSWRIGDRVGHQHQGFSHSSFTILSAHSSSSSPVAGRSGRKAGGKWCRNMGGGDRGSQSWGWSSGSLSHSWSWGQGCWKQHPGGRRREGSTCASSPASPPSPQLLADAGPAPALPGSSCPHPWEAAGRTLNSCDLSLTLGVGTSGTRHLGQLHPLCVEHEERDG